MEESSHHLQRGYGLSYWPKIRNYLSVSQGSKGRHDTGHSFVNCLICDAVILIGKVSTWACLPLSTCWHSTINCLMMRLWVFERLGWRRWASYSLWGKIRGPFRVLNDFEETYGTCIRSDSKIVSEVSSPKTCIRCLNHCEIFCYLSHPVGLIRMWKDSQGGWPSTDEQGTTFDNLRLKKWG